MTFDDIYRLIRQTGRCSLELLLDSPLMSSQHPLSSLEQHLVVLASNQASQALTVKVRFSLSPIARGRNTDIPEINRAAQRISVCELYVEFAQSLRLAN